MPTASRKGKPPMSDKIIKNGRVVSDDRLTVSLAEGEAATDIAVPAGPTFCSSLRARSSYSLRFCLKWLR